jgi:hypothetical protein
MDDRAKALEAGNKVVHGRSGIMVSYGIALKPDVFIEPLVGHRGRVPALRDRSPLLFSLPSPACGVSHLGQDPNPTGRREHTI